MENGTKTGESYGPEGVRVSVSWLTAAIRDVFRAEGFSEAAAQRMADGLVAADLSGVPSHGSMLLPMYINRIRAGSVSRQEAAQVVVDNGAVAVLDAAHGLGLLTGVQAMSLAVDKAQQSGLGMTVVRRAFHFGRAGTYVEVAAARGCLGIAMSNTRPLMPAPGGAVPVVGNNPIAIGTPARGRPVILDMALSEVALGKIRLAEADGEAIPDTWATDAQGLPTTDPHEAIAGMLLPAGGAKGFGLALMVDVLTGVLSGGASGNDVKPLYLDMSIPNDCAHSFIAIDVAAFGDVEGFYERLEQLTGFVLGSLARPGQPPVMLPGQRAMDNADASRTAGVVLERSVLDGVLRTAETVGASIPDPEFVTGEVA